MIEATRDILAVLFLEKRLGVLREEALSSAVAGAPLPPEHLAEGEAAIFAEMRRRFYTAEMQQACNAGDPRAADAGDGFDQRTQKLAEHAILTAHRRLAAIPFVSPSGQGEP